MGPRDSGQLDSNRPSSAGFILAGGYVLACIPAIFLCERRGWSQAPFHATQFFACILCLVLAVRYLRRAPTPSEGEDPSMARRRKLAVVAVVLTSGWLLFVVVIAIAFMVAMREFD